MWDSEDHFEENNSSPCYLAQPVLWVTRGTSLELSLREELIGEGLLARPSSV